jgi:hypothetical protein
VKGEWTTCSLVGQQQNTELLRCHGCPRTFHRQCLPTKHISRPAASGEGEPDILCELCAPLGWDAFAELDEKQQAEAQEAQEEARHEAVAELMQEFDGLKDDQARSLLDSCVDDKQLAADALWLVQMQGQVLSQRNLDRARRLLEKNGRNIDLAVIEWMGGACA